MKRFFSYYKPYRWLFTLDFSCAVLAGVLELAFPIAVNQVIDKVMPTNKFKYVLLACAALFFFYVFNTLLQYIVVYFGHKLGVNIETDMREELFAHLQTQSFTYYDEQKTGKLMSRLTTDLFEISELAHHGPEDIFITMMTLAGSFILMMRMNVSLALATFALIPCIMIALVFFNKKMTRVNTKIYDNLGEFNAGIESAVSGIRVTQSFANEAHEQARFERLSQIYRQSKLTFYRVMAVSSAYNYLFIRLINLFTLIFGSYFVIKGQLTYGSFVGFILLANVFIRPIEKVNTMIESYPKGIAGFKRLMAELDKEPAIQDAPGAQPLAIEQGAISYEQVTFRYADGTTVFEDLSLDIAPGETIAFVGESGAGKTTLCNLLPRFYDVAAGDILIDQQSIQSVTLASLRQHIGIVQQDVYLFPGTVRENILYGRLDASEEAVLQAVKLAHLEKVVAQLPNGLDTIVGERGVKLSGGQKQRIAIARMFLKNPEILILDEATSALDTETEKVIQTSMLALSEGRTTLIIAHRLATIQHADRIVVMGPEGIVETGAHAELLERNGAYRKLYDAQFNKK